MTAASADLYALAADLSAASGEPMVQAAQQVLHGVASTVAANMAADAPKRTGELAASIAVTQTGPLEMTVGPTGQRNVKVGGWQEFGTGSRGEFGGSVYVIRPKRPGGRLVFKVGDKTVFAREVHHPGVSPHPFARPAVAQALGPLVQQMADAGALMITQGPRA